MTAVFFCSGAVALVYQVLWQRRFAAVFGSAAPATAAVLAAFFTGLGAGSRTIGAAARRWRRPLRAFALLEAAVGASALLVGPLLVTLDGLAPRLVTAFLAVAVPTFCMGGTLPALARFVDGGERRLGVNAGRLYASNTAGAALGALAVPYVLLPRLGAGGTLHACVAANALLALLALGLDRLSSAMPAAEPRPARPGAPGAARGMRPLLLASLLSGLVSFALEVSWNRAFAQVHENSVHSFAVIVAVFIAALALGAQLARSLLRRGVRPERLIGAAWIAAGALAAASCWSFLQLTDGLAYLAGSDGASGVESWRLLRLAAVVVLPPLTLVGMALPAIMERAGRLEGSEPGDTLGRLLAVNVIGCVAGALAAGFLLPRWLGLWGGMFLVAATLVVAGAWQLDPWRGAPARRRRVAAAAILAALVWAAGGRDWPRVRVEAGRSERLVALAEGTHGIVAVVERPGSRRLKLNNFYVLGGTASAGDERMQVHLPLLLHPAPRRVLLLGLGTGISAGGALLHPVDRLTAVELVPEVVDAARVSFREANLGVLADPRTRVIVDDARSYLAGTTEEYDVIVGDLVVPWRQGEAGLYTLEQLTAAREALAPGGLFCQWLPLFQLSEVELEIVVRTFLAVFERAQVWRGDFSAEEPAVALCAAPGGRAPDPRTVERRVRETRPDPANPHLAEPYAIWMHFAGVREPGDLAGHTSRLHTDDTPWLELQGPPGRRGSSCAGRCLARWLRDVRRRSAGRLGGLGDAQLAAMDDGELLLDFSLALAEGDEPRARALHERLRARLPTAVFDAIFPREPPAGGS